MLATLVPHSAAHFAYNGGPKIGQPQRSAVPFCDVAAQPTRVTHHVQPGQKAVLRVGVSLLLQMPWGACPKKAGKTIVVGQTMEPKHRAAESFAAQCSR